MSIEMNDYTKPTFIEKLPIHIKLSGPIVLTSSTQNAVDMFIGKAKFYLTVQNEKEARRFYDFGKEVVFCLDPDFVYPPFPEFSLNKTDTPAPQ
jgi:hypothetical protein